MSVRKLNIEDNKNDYFIKEFFSDSENTNINIYLQILANKKTFYITNLNHSNHIEIKSSSLSNIFLKGQLEANEHILFSFYQDIIPSNLSNNKNSIQNKNKKENTNKLRGSKKKHKIENENKVVAEVISYPDNIIQKNENEYNNNICLNIDNDNDNDNENDNDIDKNENTSIDPELDLLNYKPGKNKNRRIKTEDKNAKYLKILFNNKIIITNILLCFYLCLSFCGLIYGVYFFEILINEEKNIICPYITFSLPMSIILIVTGLYGYYRINEKVYDDKICIFLTYISFFSPFLSFILARISPEERVRKNIFMSVFVNIIIACFSGICIFIVRRLKGKREKDPLFEKINIV